MLANGTTLGYKKDSTTTTYTNLPGLKEIPDMGVEAEKVDNTVLTDKHKKYDLGIGDLPDMVYKFKWDNSSADCPYRVLKAAEEDGEALYFQEKMKDGTVTEFTAIPSVKRTGGGVNGVIDAEVTMVVQSDITMTDPE